MGRVGLLLILIGGLLTVMGGTVKQPNIVMFVADDLGWGDMPWHDSLAIAPTLTQLANTGTILEQHYVQQICSPTRSALMTGKYPSRLGLNHDTINAGEPFGVGVEEKLISNYMKELGYITHSIGKWHLGFCSWALTPTQRGFDTALGFYNGHESYYRKLVLDYFDYRLDTLDENNNTTSKVMWSGNGTYSTYLYAQRARHVIKDHQAKHQTKPLFLYFPIQSVHNPPEVPPKYRKLYDGIVFNEDRKTLLAMITAMDDAAGEVVSTLKETGLWENTIFIFFSDNGGPIQGLNKGQINYPLRGGKHTYWEGGIRSVSFVHSPMLPGMRINNELIHVTDWLPTLTHLAACGVDSEECSGPDLGDIDGVNQWAAISGRGRSNRTEFLVNIDPILHNAAIRVGPWKLYTGNPGKGDWIPPPKMGNGGFEEQFTIHRADRERYDSDLEYMMAGSGYPNRAELYNVILDPAETNEISAENPDVVQTMLDRLNYYRTRTVKPKNKPKDPASDPNRFGGVWTPWLESC